MKNEMDALTAAGAFGTIVQLICNYRAEKGADAALNHQQFVEWLDYHRHEEIKNLICNTAALRTEIDNVLKADHVVIKEKLDAINTTLATLTSHVTEFRGLTVTMMPGAELSEQAISILRQLVRSGSSWFISHRMFRAPCLLRLEQRGQIKFSEHQFLDDDLYQLVASGLLSHRYTNDGKNEVYGTTRNAKRLLEVIDGKQTHGQTEVLER